MATANTFAQLVVALGAESVRFDRSGTIAGVAAKVDRTVKVIGDATPDNVVIFDADNEPQLDLANVLAICLMVDPDDAQATVKNVEALITFTNVLGATKTFACKVNKRFPLVFPSAKMDDQFSAIDPLIGNLQRIEVRAQPGTTAVTDDQTVRLLLLASA